MGLDITAYSKLVFVETLAKDDRAGIDAMYEKYDTLNGQPPYVFVWPRPDALWQDRMAPLTNGDGITVYRCDGQEMGFRAGSYSGYNRWREALCALANRCEPQYLWNNRDTASTQAMPFFELIDFSDCEGTLGSTVCQKLAQDFAKFDAKAQAEMDEYTYSKYREWHAACQLAADNGCIELH